MKNENAKTWTDQISIVYDYDYLTSIFFVWQDFLVSIYMTWIFNRPIQCAKLQLDRSLFSLQDSA